MASLTPIITTTVHGDFGPILNTVVTARALTAPVGAHEAQAIGGLLAATCDGARVAIGASTVRVGFGAVINAVLASGG